MRPGRHEVRCEREKLPTGESLILVDGARVEVTLVTKILLCRKGSRLSSLQLLVDVTGEFGSVITSDWVVAITLD